MRDAKNDRVPNVLVDQRSFTILLRALEFESLPNRPKLCNPILVRLVGYHQTATELDSGMNEMLLLVAEVRQKHSNFVITKIRFKSWTDCSKDCERFAPNLRQKPEFPFLRICYTS
ncbi:hypothetical protein RF11_12604 [Thelohanellus kitauei]|uniref:Uncharacterized protein n=1 Tax=Thelohanellus kitauei TaxID=669202 RepID=A0A0C2IZT5_THEKT|nr:hypothetical protein RF11_12604 [Thelohanellus kitauei]